MNVVGMCHLFIMFLTHPKGFTEFVFVYVNPTVIGFITFFFKCSHRFLSMVSPLISVLE